MPQRTALPLLTAYLLGSVPAIGQAPAQPSYHGHSARVSPDGKHVVFARDTAGERIPFMMNADGSDQHPLPGRQPVFSWMPDGKRLLIGLRLERSGSIHLGTMKLDGTDVKEIALGSPSPTGGVIVGGANVLFLSPIRDITGRAAAAGMIRDSTGGRVPAFFYLMGIDGRNVRPFSMPDRPGRTVSTALSNDGQRVAITVVDTTPDSEGFPRSGMLYVMNVDGTGLRKVATMPGFLEQPAWSSDGRKIVLVNGGRVPQPRPAGYVGDAFLVIVDVESGATRQFPHTSRRFVDELPNWSPDGNIYFQSDRDGRMEIYRMRADGSKLERLTR